MSDYIITIEDWFFRYAHERYPHFFGCPIEEIVRCMDCVWFTNSPYYGAYCTNFGSPLGDDYDGFCAWGKRRDDGQTE